MEKNILKKMICEYIDSTDIDNIDFYESNPLTERINEFGNFVYVKSNSKEVRLNLKFDER